MPKKFKPRHRQVRPGDQVAPTPASQGTEPLDDVAEIETSSAGLALPEFVTRLLPTPQHHMRAAVVVAILLLGLLTRSIGIGTMPPVHATDDEYWYSWSGLSLLHGKQPTSWSLLAGYGDRTLGWAWFANEKYHFVKPAVDHPPLFSLLAGAFVSLTRPPPLQIDLKPKGSVQLWDVNLGRARVLTLLLYCVSFFLLLDLAALSLGFWPACVALAFYSFPLPMVLHQRLLVADNLITPLLLGNVVILQRFLLGRCSARTFAIVTLVTLPCAVLTKLAAITQTAVIAGILLLRRHMKLAAIPVLGAIIGLALVGLYAAAIDWQLFRAVQASQAERFAGFNFLERVFAGMALVGHPQFSYVLAIGWIFLLAMAMQPRAPIAALAGVSYMLAMTFFAARQVWGWHQLATYPFLCVGYAWAFRKVWQRPTGVFTVTILGLLAIWSFQNFYQLVPRGETPLRLAFVAVILLSFAAVPFAVKPQVRMTVRVLIIALIGTGLLMETIRTHRITRTSFPEAKPTRPTGRTLETPPGRMR